MIRNETSDATAARFLATYRPRRPKRRRQGSHKAAAESSSADHIRMSLVRGFTRVVALSSGTARMFEALAGAVWVPERAVAAPGPLPAMPRMPFESNAEKLRRYRAAATERGLCYSCRKRPAKSGARYCVECIAKSDRYKKSIAYVKCQNCGGKVNGTLLCSSCTGKSSSYNRAIIEARRSAGECIRCGRSAPHPGFDSCLSCLEETRDRVLALMRERGRKPRACPVCRELGINGTGHDRRTHDRWMARRQAWSGGATA